MLAEHIKKEGKESDKTFQVTENWKSQSLLADSKLLTYDKLQGQK